MYAGKSVGADWCISQRAQQQLLAFNNYLYQITDNTITDVRPYNWRYSKAMLRQKDGSFLLGLLDNRGLRYYASVDDIWRGKYKQYLLGQSVSHLYRNEQGELWVGTLEHGVFHCPDLGRSIFDRSTGLPIDYVSAITFAGADNLYLGLRNGQVFRLSLATEQLEELPPVPGVKIIYDLHFDEEYQTLWVANYSLAWLTTTGWRQPDFVNLNTGGYHRGYGKKLVSPPLYLLIYGGVQEVVLACLTLVINK